MPKFLAGCHYIEEEISRHLKKYRISAGPNQWQQVCNWSNPEKTVRSCEGADFSWLSSKVSQTLPTPRITQQTLLTRRELSIHPSHSRCKKLLMIRSSSAIVSLTKRHLTVTVIRPLILHNFLSLLRVWQCFKEILFWRGWGWGMHKMYQQVLHWLRMSGLHLCPPRSSCIMAWVATSAKYFVIDNLFILSLYIYDIKEQYERI
jgi:hypothetical protein